MSSKTYAIGNGYITKKCTIVCKFLTYFKS